MVPVIIYDNLFGLSNVLNTTSISTLEAFRKRNIESYRSEINVSTIQNVIDRLNELKNDDGIFVFYGHGCLCGDSYIFDECNYFVGSNEMHLFLNKKLIYTIACFSAKKFGILFTQKTETSSFLGYNHYFKLGAVSSRYQAFIKQLIEAANSGLRDMIIENISTKQAKGRIRYNYRLLMREVAEKKFRELGSRRGFYLEIVYWNFCHLEMYGNDFRLFDDIKE